MPRWVLHINTSFGFRRSPPPEFRFGVGNMGTLKMSRMGVLCMVVWIFVSMTSMVKQTDGSTFIVGGERWHFGVNYSDWASKAAPFYVNDTLVFRYARPNGSIFHNVYRLPSYRSYVACNFQKAKLLAHENAGYGDGFAYVLNESKPYYFGCGIGDGFHCNVGLMKFYVRPVARCVCASASLH